jgi:dephospho-CoA kinase
MDIGDHHLWWLGRNARMERLMTRNEIIEMAKQSGLINKDYDASFLNKFTYAVENFAKLVEENVRRTINEEAKDYLEELRKNFDAESAKQRLEMWSQEKKID